MLRASYTPSPSARKLGTPTPQRMRETPTFKKTPSRSRGFTPGGGAVDEDTLAEMRARREKREQEARELINTDNLLNIGGSALKARPRAKDFFMKPSD